MDKRTMKEDLTIPVKQQKQWYTLLPQRRARHQQVQALLDLAEELQGVLVPVEPDARFRQRLRSELSSAAQRRRVGATPGLFRQHRRGILIGAAAVGSVASIVGVVVAFVLRYRHSRVTHAATG